jgi:hypothetical protein
MNRNRIRPNWVLAALVPTLAFPAATCMAQLGSGWMQYKPEQKIHLVDFNYPARKGMRAFDWTNHVEVGSPTSCASYDFDAKTDTETFKLLDKRSNRAEIRLQNDYATGSRQFEGYVTFYAPLNDESLFQIWGSDRGATQMMMRGYAANGGEIGINQEPINGTPRVATNCYGREIKVNVIHLQEDVGGKFLVYLGDKKVIEFADGEHPKNNNGKNYHKYGCYGTLKTDGAVVKWRKVRHFKDGTAPVEAAGRTRQSGATDAGVASAAPAR